MKQIVPYVIYCRASSWSQAKRHHITRQLNACLKSVGEIEGAEIVGVFTEIASGSSDLPVRAAALRYAKQQGAKIMVESVYEWKRRADEPRPRILQLADPRHLKTWPWLEAMIAAYKNSLQPAPPATCDWPAAPCTCTD